MGGFLGDSALMNISGTLRRTLLELSRFQGVHKSPVPISATAPHPSSNCTVLSVLKDFKSEQSIPGTGFDAFQQPSIMKYNKLRKPSISVSSKSLIFHHFRVRKKNYSPFNVCLNVFQQNLPRIKVSFD